MRNKILSIAVAVFAVIAFSQGAYCGNGNGSSGEPNGKPFQAIHDQIDSLQSQMDELVDLAASMEELATASASAMETLEQENALLAEQIADNKGDITDLQAQVDENTTMIELLAGQIAQVEAALATKQNIIDGVCPSGEYMTQVLDNGSVVCAAASGGSSESSSYKVYNYADVDRYTEVSATATCPDGTNLIGGAAKLALTHYHPYYRTQLGGTSIEDNSITATAQGGLYQDYRAASNMLTVYAICQHD